MDKKQLVVIGGGTGTHTILRGLKNYQSAIDITSIVTMADSGGSTGRLRDEFGYLPVGDVRMALTALARDTDEHENLLRELFLYRFDKGEGLSGHNFGNLLLVALTDILGSEEAAILAAAKVLRVSGKVLPVTTEKISLTATYDDGVEVIGQHKIDTPTIERVEHKIMKIGLVPEAKLSAGAEAAILAAEVIVLGPGDLYTSILANCVVGGVKEAILKSPAKVIYVCNLMTRYGQTSNLGVVEHTQEITSYIGKKPDVVLVNNGDYPSDLLDRYAEDKEFPVASNFSNEQKEFIAADLIATAAVKTVAGDKLKRSLIRHDSNKLAAEIMKIILDLNE